MRNAISTQEQKQEFDTTEEFIQLENNCTLCGANLQFEYEMTEQEVEIVEKKECPSCGLRTQSRFHSVH